MKKVIYKFAASAAMVMCAARGAQAAVAAGEGQEPGAQASHNRFDDAERWKQTLVLSAFVNVEEETVTLRGLNFGKKVPTVFCETDRMRILRASETELVVRFPKAVEDGTYLFTVARGNLDFERGQFYVTKVTRWRRGDCAGARGSCRAGRSCGAGGSCWSSGCGGAGRCNGPGWSCWRPRSDRAGGSGGSGGCDGCRGAGGSAGSGRSKVRRGHLVRRGCLARRECRDLRVRRVRRAGS